MSHTDIGSLTANQYQDIKIREKQFLTDSDLRRFFPNNKDPKPIIKYSDLAKVKSIYELLPNDKDFKVILIDSDPL